MESTTDIQRGEGWVSAECAALGVEGTVSKPLTSRYPARGGPCGWLKVRYRTTADAVVVGVIGSIGTPTALVLGQPGPDGRLRMVGLSTTLPRTMKVALAGRLRPAGQRRRAPAILAGLPGGEAIDFLPVRPGVLIEVETDSTVEWGRFRHRLSPLRVLEAPD